jgi:hypothetical protein
MDIRQTHADLALLTGGAASVTCLNFGNYTSQYHICSIQTIYVLHAYEHLVGSTNQWVAMRSVAVVIAKGLGLHKYVLTGMSSFDGDDMITFADIQQGSQNIQTITRLRNSLPIKRKLSLSVR